MQIKNNYDIFWEREKYGYETGNGVFNGEFGTILKLDDIDKVFILHDLYSIEETKQIKQKVKEIIDNK